jgi:hypothetical protein
VIRQLNAPDDLFNTARVALRLTRRSQGTTVFSEGLDWPHDNDVKLRMVMHR